MGGLADGPGGGQGGKSSGAPADGPGGRPTDGPGRGVSGNLGDAGGAGTDGARDGEWGGVRYLVPPLTMATEGSPYPTADA